MSATRRPFDALASPKSLFIHPCRVIRSPHEACPPVPPTAAAVRRVAAPYKMNRHKIPQNPRADNIRPYTVQYTSAAVFSAGEQSSPLRCADDNSPQTEPIKGGFMPREHPAKHLRYDFPRGFSGMGIFYTNKDSFFAVL